MRSGTNGRILLLTWMQTSRPYWLHAEITVIGMARSLHPDGPAHRRYSPGEMNGSDITVVSGAPKLEKVSTSYAEQPDASHVDASVYPPDQRFLKED